MFLHQAQIFNIAGAKYITIKVKGTSGGVSFNLGTVGSGKLVLLITCQLELQVMLLLRIVVLPTIIKVVLMLANWITIKLDLAGSRYC